MLEDGLLDAWLMELFGRSLDVAIARTVIVGAFLGVSIWFLGIAVFDSIPLALVCVAMGSWTTAENNRTFFQVAAVALFWNALRRAQPRLGGAAAASSPAWRSSSATRSASTRSPARWPRRSALDRVAARRVGRPAPGAGGRAFSRSASVLGAAPFAIYLADARRARRLHRDVVRHHPAASSTRSGRCRSPTSSRRSARDLNLHTLADFVLWEKFHLILSPLTIAIAAIYFDRTAGCAAAPTRSTSR